MKSNHQGQTSMQWRTIGAAAAMYAAVQEHRASDRGASMAEYALLLAFVLVVAVVVVAFFGESVMALFQGGPGAMNTNLNNGGTGTN